MKISIPKEVKNNEFRVAITPAGVHELVSAGHGSPSKLELVLVQPSQIRNTNRLEPRLSLPRPILGPLET